MADKPWIFDQRGKSAEESYHHKKEQEALDRLRGRVEQERKRRGLSEELNIYDEKVLDALDELGFTREVLVLLHIVPLIEVAWSDGSISPAERAKLLEIAASRGIVSGTPAYEKMIPMLDERPAEAAFRACTRVIRAMFATLTPEQQRGIEGNLPAYAAAVARASGGLLGMAAISSAEQAVIDRISREIAEAHADAAKKTTTSS